jgi:hypothetical protein
MFNTYNIEATPCPECDAKELVYSQYCNAVACQECGLWFDLSGNILENESEA